MREFSELQEILLNETFMGHLRETMDWLEVASIAVLVPVVLTTAHSTYRNYYFTSQYNAIQNPTMEQSMSNVLQSMVMTATGQSRLMVT